ncbi:ribosome silencing factor [Desulfosoma caldarium]|uniref:Ribosomal silencing factor RsfS n=1 Tax=Desulfosoma caldarium TaxID=610254 RepID=A0A3N1USY9_9BACT|nr:ribosome silencing factor [Desulfosoma caldarium]ROQ90961.1 ribosome-associated protein [Desulfosoma caldarium]
MANTARQSENTRTRMDPLSKALSCAKEADTRKALDMVLLDVSKITTVADYFLICSGRSSRQVQGIAEAVQARLRQLGVRPLGVEGEREGHWVLLDYGDVIVHIFYQPIRELYDLESLWSEGAVVPLDEHLVVPKGERE